MKSKVAFWIVPNSYYYMNFDPNNFKTYLIWDYISGYAVGLI